MPRILIVAGIVLVAAGLVWWLAGDKLNWIGKLPGDIRHESGNVKFYFPVTTMIFFSLLLSLIIWLARRL